MEWKSQPLGVEVGVGGEGRVDTRLRSGESTDQESGRQNKSEVWKQ